MSPHSDLYLAAALLVVLSVVLSVGTTLLILRSAFESAEYTPGQVIQPSPIEPVPLHT